MYCIYILCPHILYIHLEIFCDWWNGRCLDKSHWKQVRVFSCFSSVLWFQVQTHRCPSVCHLVSESLDGFDQRTHSSRWPETWRRAEEQWRAVESSGEQWRAMEKSCFSRFPPCLAHHASAKTLEILGVSWSLFSGVRGAWDWLWLLTKCFRLLDYNNFVLTWSLWVSLYDKITRSIIFALSSWSQLPWRRSLLVWWTFPLRSVVPQSWLTLSSFEDDFAIAIIYCNIYIYVYIYICIIWYI